MAIVAPVLGFTPKSHTHSLTHSFPSSFSPWVSSLVTSSAPWSGSPSLVSSVASGSSSSVAWVGGLNLARPSSGGLSGGVCLLLRFAGSSFAMLFILAPGSTVVSSCVSSSGFSVSWSSPSLVSSVPPVVRSSVAGSIPSVPRVGVVSGVGLGRGGGGVSVVHQN